MNDFILYSLIALWIAYVIALSIIIVLQKRPPISSLSWILSLAFLPYFGFLIYYVLGPQRLKRQRLRRLRVRASLHTLAEVGHLKGSLHTDVPVHVSQQIRLGQATTDFPISTCHTLDLLIDGEETFGAIFAAIRAAKYHVHLEYYIYEPDKIGTALRDLLIEKASKGVKVRLLVDALGGAKLKEKFLAPLRSAGAEIAFFHPTRMRARPVWNMRTHRKIVVCDGEVGFTGGINICDNEDERTRPDAYHDAHLHIEGAAVRWLQTIFVEDWFYTTNEALASDNLLPNIPPGPFSVQIIPSGPDSEWEAIHRMYISAIENGTKRIWLTTPYFVPGEAALMAITSAALRGVEVKLLVPRRGDSAFVTAAARSYYDELLRAGVLVFEYTERMLHSKTLVVDDDFALIGTANFDNRSFRLNFEVCATAYGKHLNAQLVKQFQKDLRTAKPVSIKRAKPPFHMRLFDAVARLFSPLL
ncbi:MAG: cardiolipin synthase [Burkholderiales bacterium]